MLYSALHNLWLRLFAALAGEALIALGVNLFIVPLGLYSGGVLGVCQLFRTLLQTYVGLDFGTFDITGVLYFIVNIPILLYGYKVLGRSLAGKTIICTVAYSLFSSIIPIPNTPIVNDFLTSCLIGGLLTGFGSGIVLTCGCSSGGLDVVGLCLSKKGSSFTVGRFSLTFNFFLYAICLFLFNVEVAIYSVIYNFATVMVMDRMHQQNISVQALIFTRGDGYKLGQEIISKLGRGVTYWNGAGAFAGASIRILCVCLSKYEVEDLVDLVQEKDPNAFFTIQEGVQVYGNFHRKIG
jgi:uncharacterized membrane-anchored protein YitT (DUF2179 family)